MEQSRPLINVASIDRNLPNLVPAYAYRAGWAAVLLVSAWIRFFDLAAVPLSPAEVNEALVALLGVGDGAVRATSGLLASANRVLFWLLGSGEGVARLPTAFAGVLMPLSAWLFVRRLGQKGALATAVLLAISPSAVYLSRRVSGDIIGIVAVLFALGALDRYWHSKERRWSWAAGVAIGLGIASGPTFLSLLLAAGVATLIARSAMLRQNGRQFDIWGILLAALVCLLAFSTAFFFNPAGLGVVADGLEAWLSGFGFRLDHLSWTIGILLGYEPLITVLGLLGLAKGLLDRDGWSRILGTWLLVAALIAVFRTGQSDAPFLLLLPLALSAGLFLDSAIAGIVKQPGWRENRQTLVVGVVGVIVLGLHVFISLGQYARFSVANPERASTSLLLAGISAILIAGVITLIGTCM